jgi:hypothetical protein
MISSGGGAADSLATYYVDEAGDGVLFGPKGRNRLDDSEAPRFFMLGMVRCAVDAEAGAGLDQLRQELLAHPLYRSIPSMAAEERKTSRAFHAKDDHPEVRARVFEHLMALDFRFFAVIKDMRAVLKYVKSRNQTDPSYRYHPNEVYDLTVRLLFNQRLHTESHYRITFARRGKSDRTEALRRELELTRQRFLQQYGMARDPRLEIMPAYPWERSCLQIADYCLWALQRCYEKHEARFLHAIWPKVTLIQDVDDPDGKAYGTFLTHRRECPDVEQIKNRRI